MAASSSSETTYFDDPQFSDLTLRLSNDRAVHVHRVILCRGSDYFKKLLTGYFSESSAKEIKLHDDNPGAMMEVLRFIYGTPYDTITDLSFLYHATVYVTAEKYQLEKMKQQVLGVLGSLALPEESNWEHTEVSEENESASYSDIFDALRAIFSGTLDVDDPARLLLARRCYRLVPNFWKQPKFEVLLRELPDVAVVLLKWQSLALDEENTTVYLKFVDSKGASFYTSAPLGTTPNDCVRAVKEYIWNDFTPSLLNSITFFLDLADQTEYLEVKEEDFDTSFTDIYGPTENPEHATGRMNFSHWEFPVDSWNRKMNLDLESRRRRRRCGHA